MLSRLDEYKICNLQFKVHVGLKIYIICIICETILPGMKDVILQKGQEPNPTHHRSEGPYHNLEKIVHISKNPHRHTHLK